MAVVAIVVSKPMKTVLEMMKEALPGFPESGFQAGDGSRWSAKYLYEQVKEQKLQSENVCIRHLDLSAMPWENMDSMDGFLFHSARVAAADLSHPIIIGYNGYIMDGWHRLAKAVLENKKTIKAYRFEHYLEPDTKAEE